MFENTPIQFGEIIVELKNIIIEEFEYSGSSDLQNGLYCALESDKNIFIFLSINNVNPGRNFLKSGKGVSCVINEEHLLPGEYKVFCYTVYEGHRTMIHKTGKRIIIN
jgi:hypothetical protein